MSLPIRADNAASDAFVGTYQGTVWSNGSYWRIITTFEHDEDGVLKGHYTYEQEGGPFFGEITRIRIIDDRHLVAIWIEPVGNGTLEAEFTGNHTAFVGLWSTLDDSSQAYAWVGERID